jgi:hypothetical protein
MHHGMDSGSGGRRRVRSCEVAVLVNVVGGGGLNIELCTMLSSG